MANTTESGAIRQVKSLPNGPDCNALCVVMDGWIEAPKGLVGMPGIVTPILLTQISDYFNLWPQNLALLFVHSPVQQTDRDG